MGVSLQIKNYSNTIDLYLLSQHILNVLSILPNPTHELTHPPTHQPMKPDTHPSVGKSPQNPNVHTEIK